MIVNERKAGVILSYLTMAANVISGIIYVPFLLGTLGQEEYGLYQLLGGMAAYASLFDLGLSNTVTRFYLRYKQLGDRTRLENVLALSRMIFWGLTLICLAVFLAIYFNLQNVFPKLETDQIADGKVIFAMLIVSICSSIPTYVYQAVSNAEEKFIFIRGLALFAAVLQPICVVLVVLQHPSAISVVAVQTVLNVTLACVRILYVKLNLKVKFKFHGWDKVLVKSLFSYSIFVFLNTIADQINWELGKTLVGILQGETAAVAVLSIGLQLAKYYMMFSSNVQSVFFPAVQKCVTSDPSMTQANAIFLKVSRIQLMILGLILSGFVIFGQEFINIWSGSENAGAYYIALSLMVVLLIPLSQNVGISILQAQNNHKYRSLVYLILSAINLAVSIPAIMRFGEYGAALGSVIAFFIGNNILICIVYKFKGHIAIGKYFKFFVKYIAIVACLAIPSYFLNTLVVAEGYLLLIAKILIYTVLYAILIWFVLMNGYEKNLILSGVRKMLMFAKKRTKSNNIATATPHPDLSTNFADGFVLIKDKKMCCGCEACVNACPVQCIAMTEDEEGFRYPIADATKCIKCGACERACLYTHDRNQNSDNLQCFACFNNNEAERMASSSGGLFVAFANEIVKSGGIVYGAAFDLDLGAVHKRAETAEECRQFQGSKYVQSHNNICYKQVKDDLKCGKTVLYSGTPCQINGLYSYLGNIPSDNLYCVDIICHGVPSNLIYKGYLDYIAKKYKKPVREIQYRSKRNGWLPQSICIVFDDGSTEISPSNTDPFYRAFLSDVLLRPSCLHCPSNNHYNKADVTIGDYWGWQNEHKALFDNKGMSALIVRTEKGRKLWEQISPGFTFEDASLSDMQRCNPNIYTSKKQYYDRNKFVLDLKVRDFDTAVDVTLHISLIKKIYRKMRTVVNLIKQRMHH